MESSDKPPTYLRIHGLCHLILMHLHRQQGGTALQVNSPQPLVS